MTHNLKSLFIITALLLYLNSSMAQQWISKKYAYDSLLNVTYGTAINFNGGMDTLEMDIYTPQCDDSARVSGRPLLVWIHGGAFLAGDKSESSITNLCKQFAERGYVTASINYRLGFIADDVTWLCNFPNYSCAFAADSAEWYRAYYRSIQDGKGALRYLVNRHSAFRIDTGNVFVAGESAGAFIALGIGLLDTIIERLPQTYAITDAAKPNANALSCQYNLGKTFSDSTISRPDLGGIEGDIEPTTINYTIKAIGNMYGGMLSNLLKSHAVNKPLPSIYSFHQPCDMVVPIDSGVVYAGLSWCMTNGYNCSSIANTSKVYGSRAFSQWNTGNNYGYNIHDEFTTTNFPYSFLLGTGSCADQINNPCHAYDNFILRENNLASFFAPIITTTPVCDTSFYAAVMESTGNADREIKVYPNPTGALLNIECENFYGSSIKLFNAYGQECIRFVSIKNKITVMNLNDYPRGIYFLLIQNSNGPSVTRKIIKE